MTTKRQTVFIRTFGCQMNVRDSEIIMAMLQNQGYQAASIMEDAGIVIFNTCSVRKQAENRVWGKIGMMKHAQNGDSPHSGTVSIIGVVGCMAQAYQDEILEKLSNVDFVCGPANIYDIPELLQAAIKKQTKSVSVDKKTRPLKKDKREIINLKSFVSIMYGCNNFCSYCIVPYVRGREESRPLTHILEEVKDLANKGCKEVTLLGQNVNSYGNDLRGKINFVRLLEELNNVKGIERIRFMTSHPKDASKELFLAMRDLPKVCEHLHLPLQSGSDKILKVMNRKYTLKHYLKLVDSLRKTIPSVSLTTDIIVGFPLESETDFKKTYQAMKRLKFDESFIFKYSSRPKTKAAKLEDNVAMDVKRRRNQDLLKLQEKNSYLKSKSLVGECVEVLVEGKGTCLVQGFKRAMLSGRTRTNKVTLFEGKDSLVSSVVNVHIKRATAHTLIGEWNGKKN